MIELLAKPEVQQFIRDHEHHDPFQLVLQAKKFPHLPIREIAEQIRARQKAKIKLPEWYQTEGIIFPALLSVEQCSSEATALYKSQLLSGSKLVDLTGGAGVDTYYLSRSFASTDYVEQQEPLARITQHNFKVLQADTITVHMTQAEDFLQHMTAPVDCIFLDPARRDEHAQKVFRLEDCTPDAVALAGLLLANARHVLIKTSPMLDIEAAIRSLPCVYQVHVVAVNNECKEVLYWLKADHDTAIEPEIVAVNLRSHGNQTFRLQRGAEAAAEVNYAVPLQYIYEPNAAVLKAGAFKSVAQAYGVGKLHMHTHLYTSQQLVPDFPGRTFACVAVTAFNKKAVHTFLSDKKAHVTVRNFPVSVQQARKKLGLQEGGDAYLFLCTIEDKPKVIITEKLIV